MTGEELQEYIAKHRPSSLRISDKHSYKIGRNSGIYRDLPKTAPDNRVPVPFIRRAVKLVKGYFAKAGNITYSSKGTLVDDFLTPIFNANEEELETAAVFEDALVYGRAFELVWYEAERGFQFAVLPVDQCIPIYSTSLKPELVGFIWHRKSGEDLLATYYDAEGYTEFKQIAGRWEALEELKHLFDAVPVVEATIDRDGRNFFDHVLPLMDLYDKIISEVGNEHEKFAQSILLLRDQIDNINVDAAGLTDLDKLKLWRILDKQGDKVRDAAAYLERNVNDTFINNTLDRLERLIYEMLCLFNPNDDSFATASGVAQAYKLLGFELSVADMESYFSLFLQKRIQLLAKHKLAPAGAEEESKNVTIHFSRNLPFDIERMASIATVLSGGKQVLSRESILKLFPTTIVENPEAELKAVQEESAIGNPFGGFEE
jgi:SPP1 family phage portal protein